MRQKHKELCVFLVVLLVVAIFIGVAYYNSRKPKVVAPAPTTVPTESAFAPYRIHPPYVLLPSKELTPGAVRNETAEQVCSEGTAEFRNTTRAMKRQVYALYKVTPHQGICADTTRMSVRGKEISEACEVDHLIPLELGGADVVENLWPQPYNPPNGTPGAHAKDKVENYLHHAVCTGQMPLDKAQQAIANDWYQVYLDIDGDK